MKLIRYGKPGQECPGLLDGEGRIRRLPTTIADFSAQGLPAALATLHDTDPYSLPIVAGSPRLAPPLRDIGKIVCVGLNYVDHARETGQATPREPILFLKATSSITGPNDDIVLPPDAQKGDWEVELGVVIGRETRYVLPQAALDHIAGFCIVNDVSERSYQLERGGQWDKGKGCDSFCPIGPCLATVDEVGDFRNLDLVCKVNGRVMQAGNTRDMIFDVPYLVHYISQFMSLQPGDVICTGTPHGVGMAMTPPQWLREGDVVDLAIAGLGTQHQLVRRAPAAPR